MPDLSDNQNTKNNYLFQNANIVIIFPICENTKNAKVNIIIPPQH
jgi:hypothetical protein